MGLGRARIATGSVRPGREVIDGTRGRAGGIEDDSRLLKWAEKPDG